MSCGARPVAGDATILTPARPRFRRPMLARALRQPRRRALLARRREVQARLDAGCAAGLPARDRGVRAAATGRRPRSRRTCWTAASRSPGPSTARWSSTRSTPARTSSWRTSRTPTRRPGRTSSRARRNLRDAVERHDRVRRARDGKALPPERARRDADGPAARLAPGREARPRRRAAGLRVALRLRPLLLPQRARACSRAAPARTSTCRRWRAISRRGSGTTSSVAAQDELGIPRGTIRATVLIETILGGLRDGRDPLRAARPLGRAELRALGLHLQLHQEVPRAPGLRPARPRAGHDGRGTSCESYSQLLIQTCHRRGIHAMGGMAAQIPIKNDPAANERALEKVARRQAARSRAPDTTAPGSRIPASSRSRAAIFDAAMPGPQPDRRGSREDVAVAAADLLAGAGRARSPRRACGRTSTSASTTSRPGCAGSGCVPLYNLMEDAATAEISRTQVWQWLRHGARLEDGVRVTRELYREIRDEELAVICEQRRRRPAWRRRAASTRAAALFDRSIDRARARGLPDASRLRRALETRNVQRLKSRGDDPCSPSDARRDSPQDWSDERALGTGSSARTPPRTSRGCAGSVEIRHTLAEHGRRSASGTSCTPRSYVAALGALTGNQAMQQVKAGLKAIYLSGWQVAADANLSGHMYPDQSLYPSNVRARTSSSASTRRCSAPTRSTRPRARTASTGSRRSSRTRKRASAGRLNAFELMKGMIEAGAAAVHFEDQLASEKKCGHMGGKVLDPDLGASSARSTAARLAADVSGVPTLIVARTDANSAQLLTSDVDERDRPFLTRRAHARRLLPHPRRPRRRDRARARLRAVRGPPLVRDLGARTSSRPSASPTAIHARFPGKLLAYNCSPSFNWEKKLDAGDDRALPEGARARWATSSSS